MVTKNEFSGLTKNLEMLLTDIYKHLEPFKATTMLKKDERMDRVVLRSNKWGGLNFKYIINQCFAMGVVPDLVGEPNGYISVILFDTNQN